MGELAWGIDDRGAPGVARWALHLSWPPHTPETVGIDLLRRWPGDVLIYLGERSVNLENGDEGVTGGRLFLDELEEHWERVETWKIPCWPGYNDDLTVYKRKKLVSRV